MVVHASHHSYLDDKDWEANSGRDTPTQPIRGWVWWYMPVILVTQEA
jgi:hypothetical protein